MWHSKQPACSDPIKSSLPTVLEHQPAVKASRTAQTRNQNQMKLFGRRKDHAAHRPRCLLTSQCHTESPGHASSVDISSHTDPSMPYPSFHAVLACWFSPEPVPLPCPATAHLHRALPLLAFIMLCHTWFSFCLEFAEQDLEAQGRPPAYIKARDSHL